MAVRFRWLSVKTERIKRDTGRAVMAVSFIQEMNHFSSITFIRIGILSCSPMISTHTHVREGARRNVFFGKVVGHRLIGQLGRLQSYVHFPLQGNLKILHPTLIVGSLYHRKNIDRNYFLTRNKKGCQYGNSIHADVHIGKKEKETTYSWIDIIAAI